MQEYSGSVKLNGFDIRDSGVAVGEAPVVRLTKSQSTKSMSARPGFFRRFFSGNNSTAAGKSAIQEDGEGSANGSDSLRHKASNIFRKPGTGTATTTRPKTNGKSSNHPQEYHSTGDWASERAHLGPVPNRKHDSQLSFVNPIMPSSAITNDPDILVASLVDTRDHFLEGTKDEIPPLIPPVPDHVTAFGSLETEAVPAKVQSLAGSVIGDRWEVCSQDEKENFLIEKRGEEDERIDGQCLVRAMAFFEWQDDSIAVENYAAYLGKEEAFNVGVREEYLKLYEFTNMSILKALRLFCSRLYIRGETQVIDRILESFSRRWYACNMDEKVLTSDMAYIIAFALITLNTDLHIANVDTDRKMRKSAFVNNTMRAIQAGTGQENVRRPPLSHSASVASTRTEFSDNTIRFVRKSASSATLLEGAAVSQPPFNRHDSNERVTAQSVLQSSPPETTFQQSPLLSRRPSKRSFQSSESTSYARSSAVYLSDLLQDMYISVRNEQIRQPHILGRSNSVSGSASLNSGRVSNDHERANGRAQSFRGALHGNGSVLSFDDASGYRSPAQSTRSLSGRTTNAPYNSPYDSRLSLSSRTSLSANNTTKAHAPGPQRGLGFASSLSNVIIREEAFNPMDQLEVAQIIDEAEEDTLTLFGAPFAKEGRVKFRSREVITGRKSKHKNWSSELFAVLGKGEVRLFDFSMKTIKSQQVTFGGGDWTQNARTVVTIHLAQTWAAAVPEAARSRHRPYVWTLAMPNGDVHHFEVGTEDLINEWVSTANYWAARASKEPLLGAVDNAEYGWGQCLELLPPESAEIIATDDITSEQSQRPISHFSAYSNGASSRTRFDETATRFPGNCATIREWQPDSAPLMISALNQEDQYAALNRFVEKLEAELRRHESARRLMTRAFSPGHTNLTKALDNHERRRQYLVLEVAKYKVYIEALRHGIETAQRLQTDRENKNLAEF